jgi:hypothetical protein
MFPSNSSHQKTWIIPVESSTITGFVAAPEWEILRGSDHGSMEDWARELEWIKREAPRKIERIRRREGILIEIKDCRLRIGKLRFLLRINTNLNEGSE